MIKKYPFFYLASLTFWIGVLAIFFQMQPNEINVVRSITIDAKAAEVFPYVNNFHKWDSWSPWARIDPNAINDVAGSESGVGSVMRWSGNREVGEGSINIIESIDDKFIQMGLNMTKPTIAKYINEFSFREEAEKTTVTWTMYGKKTFVNKVMGLIFNCEKMVGEKFEQGLSNMKKAVEEAIVAAPLNDEDLAPQESTPE